MDKNLFFKSVIILLAFSLLPILTEAQLKTPEISITTYGLVNSSDSTPFWLQSNRYGMFSSGGSQFLTRVQAQSTDNQLSNNLTLSYGADFIARPVSQSAAWFNQAYLRLDAWNLFLQAGRFHNKSPIHSEELGMGALGVSGNSTPIPQIRFGLSDWTPLPFSKGFIKTKLHIAHGWLGSDRYTKDVLYHEKVIHLRFGGDFPLNVYGGMAHYALWGGNNNPEYGDLPSRLSDFSRVFRAVGGDDRAPTTERQLLLGDHLGGWDLGLFLELDAVDLKIYRNFPLESRHNLQLKSFQDALTGIDVIFVEPSVLGLKNFVYEYLYTKWQAGPRTGQPGFENSGTPGGNRNYYNNGVYKTGWSYYGRTIGNPLFLPGDDNLGIVNNRIVAHHLGVLFEQKAVTWQLKTTYSRNYGTWREPYAPGRRQISYLIGAQIPVIVEALPSLILSTEIAIDRGDLFGSQTGVLAGVKVIL